MSAELIGRFPDQSPEWYAAREGALGGSDAAALMGHSPWTSRYTLWHRKAGNIADQEPSEEMNWGKRLEGAITERWCEDHPDLIPLPGGTYRNSERPWQIANPDLLVSTDVNGTPTGLLEVKTASAFAAHEWGKSGTALIPVYYDDQTQWYLDVFGLPVAHVAVLIGGSDYREYEIEYDEQRARLLRKQGEAFLASVTAGEAPGLDGSESTYEAVRELHPDIDTGAEIELTGAQWQGFLDAEAECDAATEEFRLAKSGLLDLMGSARYGTFMGRKVVRREARGGGHPYIKKIPQPKERVA